MMKPGESIRDLLSQSLHLTEDELDDYLSESCPPQVRERLQQHLRVCRACAFAAEMVALGPVAASEEQTVTSESTEPPASPPSAPGIAKDPSSRVLLDISTGDEHGTGRMDLAASATRRSPVPPPTAAHSEADAPPNMLVGIPPGTRPVPFRIINTWEGSAIRFLRDDYDLYIWFTPVVPRRDPDHLWVGGTCYPLELENPRGARGQLFRITGLKISVLSRLSSSVELEW